MNRRGIIIMRAEDGAILLLDRRHKNSGARLRVWPDKMPAESLQRVTAFLTRRVADPQKWIAKNLPDIVTIAVEAAFKEGNDLPF